MKLSFVVPCYNEEKNIKIFYQDVVKNFKNSNYKIELIFINDGSKDNTMLELKKTVRFNDFDVKIINFSRNFGKEAGIYAGLQNSTGDYVVLIDADMQQPPHLVLKMLNVIEEDPSVDIVAYYQEKRIENKVLSFLKLNFYKLAKKITGINFANNVSDFRLMKRCVVDAILSFTEHHRFTKGIFAWIGFNTYYLPYTPKARANGNTSWGTIKLFKYALNGILSFVENPFKWVTYMGITFILISTIMFILMFTNIIQLSYIINFITLMSGINFIVLGYVGEFISRNYSEVRNRPIYVVKEVVTNEKNNKSI